MKTKIRFDRLKKLADHLMTRKLGHKKFNFNLFNDFPDNYIGEKNKCGTAGCAIGECPIIFKEWRFDKWGHPFYKTDGSYTASCAFFGIERYASYHLFCPEAQHPDAFGGKLLYANATKKQVAKNIYVFIEKMKETK